VEASQQGTSTTVVNKDPWAPSQDYLKAGFEKAQGFLDQPMEMYPESTVVPFSNQTQAGLGQAEARAMAGAPGVGAALSANQATSQGDYLNANPHMTAAINQATTPIMQNFNESIIPGIQSGFSAQGRLGSGLQAFQQQRAGEAAGRQASDIATAMSYKGYGDERNRMMQAGALAPGLEAAGYGSSAELERIGGVREGMAGAELQESINRYAQPQTAAREELARYMATIGGGAQGGASTSQQPIYGNPTAERLGMAGSAASIGNLLGMWGN
jgi:hypothetical protein